MNRVALVIVVVACATPAPAQEVNVPVQAAASLQAAPVKKLLVDGYEVKAGFADSTGGAYMVLQKATSAYLCHSNPTPNCEKLN